MIRFEKIFFGILIGSAFPLFFGLLSVTIWFYLNISEKYAPFYLIVGILLGLVIDLKNLKSWVEKRYDLSVWFLIGLYLFFNIVTFGFFMGFPVFNIFWGLVAGYYSGCRIVFKNTPKGARSIIINWISIITGIVMMLICISSASIALSGNGVGTELQSMLGLEFVVTKPMIWEIILIGGFLLIAAQIVLTRITINKTIK